MNVLTGAAQRKSKASKLRARVERTRQTLRRVGTAPASAASLGALTARGAVGAALYVEREARKAEGKEALVEQRRRIVALDRQKDRLRAQRRVQAIPPHETYLVRQASQPGTLTPAPGCGRE